MQINSLLQGYQDPMGLGKRLERAAAGAKAASSTLARGLLPSSSNPATAQIASEYDVTDMSPQQYSEMIQKLHDAGTVNDKEFRDLALLRVDLDSAGVSSTTPLNLLQFCAGKLSETQQKLQAANISGATPDTIGSLQQSASSMQQRIEWLEKLSMLHNTPGAVGVDAIA